MSTALQKRLKKERKQPRSYTITDTNYSIVKELAEAYSTPQRTISASAIVDQLIGLYANKALEIHRKQQAAAAKEVGGDASSSA